MPTKRLGIEQAIVTGADGFIGKRLVELLCRDGVKVTTVTRVRTSLDCDGLIGDITTPGLLDHLLTPKSVVFHLAAHADVAKSVSEPVYDFEVNVKGTIQVLESIRKTNAQMVFPSSAAVYDPRQPLPHSELSRLKPSSPYAAAKIACESYCDAYAACYGLDIKVARLFNTYGPGMNRFAIRDFYLKILGNPDSVEILGDGSQIRDYLYIDDTVEGLISIASNGERGEKYNLASGIPVKTVELARLVAQTMGFPNAVMRLKGESFSGDVCQWFAEITKLSSLGWAPKISLEDGLKSTVEWFRLNLK